MSNNPIGPDFEGKKYITRGGEVVTLMEGVSEWYLWSPETEWFYDTGEMGNLVLPIAGEQKDDIIAEYKEPD